MCAPGLPEARVPLPVRPQEAVPREAPLDPERSVDHDPGVNVPLPVNPLQDAENPEHDVEQSGQQEIVQRRRRHPLEPTPEQRDAHECSGHVPYGSWCRACVTGRARDGPHPQGDMPERHALLIIAIDYGYLIKREEVTSRSISESNFGHEGLTP